MNIYELRLIKHPQNHWDYHDSFVVVACSNRKARRLAADYESPRSNSEFLDPRLTTCVKFGITTKNTDEEVVVASFNAG